MTTGGVFISGEEAFPLCSEIAALSLTTLSPGTGLGAIVWGVVCKSVCVCVCIILVIINLSISVR